MTFDRATFEAKLRAELAGPDLEARLLRGLKSIGPADPDGSAVFERDPISKLTKRLSLLMNGTLTDIVPERDGEGFMTSALIYVTPAEVTP